MVNQNLNYCCVRVYDVVGQRGVHYTIKKYVDYSSPIKAVEALGIADVRTVGTYEKALEMLKNYRFELVHISKLKTEQTKQAKKRKKRKKDYSREKFAPVAKVGQPMKRLNLSVDEITQKPVKSSKNWKKAAEICRKQAKQAKRVNSSKPTEKSNKKLEKPAGLFPESTKVTKARAAEKRAKIENENIPTTNNAEYKKYKKGQSNKRGLVGTQTAFL